jgi:hypothetical protein
MRFIGCRDGARVDSLYPNSSLSFQGQNLNAGRGLRFDNCDFMWNERNGFVNTGSRSIDLSTCRMSNNGQADAFAGVTRGGETLAGPYYGYFGGDDGDAQPDTDPRVRVRMHGCETADTQTETGFGSANPATPTVVSVWQPDLYEVGQAIKLPGAGASAADLITYVVSKAQDEITIAHPIQTFATVALSGTFSTTGTTLTGSGSSLLSQVRGRAWATDGTNARLIRGVSSNTAGTLLTAFPSNLSGASLSIYRVEVQQIRSQHYGIGATSATLDDLCATGHKFGPDGNVTENTNITGEASISLAEWPALPIHLHLNDFVVANGSPAIQLSSGGIVRAWMLDPDTTESITAYIRVPRGVKTKIRARIRYFNAGSGSGNVVWRERVNGISLGSTVEPSVTPANIGTIAAPAQNILAEILGNPFVATAGDLIRYGIDRNGSSASDTLPNDVGVISVRLEVV